MEITTKTSVREKIPALYLAVPGFLIGLIAAFFIFRVPTPTENPASAYTTPDVAPAIASGDAKVVQLYLNNAVARRQPNALRCEYYCENVNGYIVIESRTQPCDTKNDAALAVALCGIEVGELMNLDCAIKSAEVEILTSAYMPTVVTLPLSQCRALTTKRNTIRENALIFLNKCTSNNSHSSAEQF